jgi:hypothetical protein
LHKLRAGVTLPRRFKYSIVSIITYLCFDDAIYGANFNALGGIKVTFTFDTGSFVNDVQGAIAFGDGVGGAFRQASAAGNTFFENFHGHGCCLLKLILVDYNVTLPKDT